MLIKCCTLCTAVVTGGDTFLPFEIIPICQRTMQWSPVWKVLETEYVAHIRALLKQQHSTVRPMNMEEERGLFASVAGCSQLRCSCELWCCTSTVTTVALGCNCEFWNGGDQTVSFDNCQAANPKFRQNSQAQNLRANEPYRSKMDRRNVTLPCCTVC